MRYPSLGHSLFHGMILGGLRYPCVFVSPLRSTIDRRPVPSVLFFFSSLDFFLGKASISFRLFVKFFKLLSNPASHKNNVIWVGLSSFELNCFFYGFSSGDHPLLWMPLFSSFSQIIFFLSFCFFSYLQEMVFFLFFRDSSQFAQQSSMTLFESRSFLPLVHPSHFNYRTTCFLSSFIQSWDER